MNLKHRLKRLENKVIDDWLTCRCNGDEQQVEWIEKEPIYYDAYKTGVYVPFQDSTDKIESDATNVELPPKTCLKCGKTINKRAIYLQLIDKKENEP
ncbi:MAG: hypothetical protein M3367_02700 [Acidobacteriota bacterium]|nr:hypothetical protein [Acidobacteriota bacterium]